MLITLKLNLPDNGETLRDIKEIVKFAITKLDIAVEVSEYGDKTPLQLSALNNVILQTIIEEFDNDWLW